MANPDLTIRLGIKVEFSWIDALKLRLAGAEAVRQFLIMTFELRPRHPEDRNL